MIYVISSWILTAVHHRLKLLCFCPSGKITQTPNIKPLPKIVISQLNSVTGGNYFYFELVQLLKILFPLCIILLKNFFQICYINWACLLKV